MKFSIITATYNSEEHILSAIRSVQEQTYMNIELIIVDGGSTDNTLKIVQENYTRELKIISEKDKGIYDALNKGVRMATGDVIGFVHSDDLLASKDIIASLASEFCKQEIDGIYGDLKYVSAQDLEKTIRYWKSNDYKREMLNAGWMPAHPTLFLKKEVYQKIGEFDLSFKIAAD
ncbi:MAG: glycosyltransferase family 2 protein, partial [Christiangramia sp.]|nr:glycosyltransferase family 2 protein [Christiangramia sp.]